MRISRADFEAEYRRLECFHAHPVIRHLTEVQAPQRPLSFWETTWGHVVEFVAWVAFVFTAASFVASKCL